MMDVAWPLVGLVAVGAAFWLGRLRIEHLIRRDGAINEAAMADHRATLAVESFRKELGELRAQVQRIDNRTARVG